MVFYDSIPKSSRKASREISSVITFKIFHRLEFLIKVIIRSLKFNFFCCFLFNFNVFFYFKSFLCNSYLCYSAHNQSVFASLIGTNVMKGNVDHFKYSSSISSSSSSSADVITGDINIMKVVGVSP